MGIWRRRRKSLLSVAALVLLGGVAVFLSLRGRHEEYLPGEETEGIVDTLARSLPSDRPALTFTDVAAEAGLDFHHFPATRSGRLPEDMGAGVALGDVDGDGWTDAFLVNTAGPLADAAAGWPDLDGRSRLFRNLGNGRFEDATASSGLAVEILGSGAAFLDADSDGDLDLFVTGYGPCLLFENDGAGRFRDVSAEAGVASFEGFWAGIAVGDYDVDGAVDVYVCGYVRYDEGVANTSHTSQFGRDIPALLNPSTFEPERNLLFRGRGDGTFEEVAVAAGVDNATGRSLEAILCDLNEDGWPDVYVANDVSDNALFLNRGDGTFADHTSEALLGDYRGAMGMAAADYDGDRDLDLFITHWVAQENALYECLPAGDDGRTPAVPTYLDAADRRGLGRVALDLVGWATGFVDFDNDGLLDLFVVNGSTIPDRQDSRHLIPMHSQVFWRAPGDRGFFDLGATAGPFFGELHVGRGGAAWDYDLDGDEDLLIVLHGEPAVLLQNDAPPENGNLRLRLRQPTGNRFALGARALVTVAGQTRLGVVGTQGSYLSQHEVGALTFGLGLSPEVERVEVIWPDGQREEGGPFPAGALVTWNRGAAPRVEVLPGRLAPDRAKPADVGRLREFYRLHEEAGDARLARDLERACELYREALDLWPGHDDCLYYLGQSNLELGREGLALAAFERQAAYYPASNRAWMQVGLVRLPGGDPELDDLDAAEAAFRRSHEINAEESRPVVQLGVVSLLRNDLEAAERYFADACQMNHRSVEARWLAGRCAFLRGDRERALTLLSEAHALARETGLGGESASAEGATASGAAMMAPGARSELSPLEAWKSLHLREVDVDAEYGGHQ